MPLRKRIGIMGVGFGVPRGSRTRLFALCYATCSLMHHRHNKPLPRLIRRTRGELSTLWLLQAYVYIVPHFQPPKLAKFKRKSGHCWPLDSYSLD